MPNVTTNSEEVFGAPAYVAAGLAGSGAVFVDLGLVPRVEVALEFFTQSLQNEIGQMMADSPMGALKGGQATLTLLRANAAQLAVLYQGLITDGATSMSVKEDLQALVPVTLHIRPRKGFGVANYKYGQWCVACRPREITAFISKVEESQNAQETFQITFDLYRATTDQAAVPQAINEGFQIWFRGSSADAVTVAWSADLPAGYEA